MRLSRSLGNIWPAADGLALIGSARFSLLMAAAEITDHRQSDLYRVDVRRTQGRGFQALSRKSV
jgi:hypothetical protein